MSMPSNGKKGGTLYYATKYIASLALDDLEGVSKCSMFFWSASREAIPTGAHCRIDAIISHLLWLASYTLCTTSRACYSLTSSAAGQRCGYPNDSIDQIDQIGHQPRHSSGCSSSR